MHCCLCTGGGTHEIASACKTGCCGDKGARALISTSPVHVTYIGVMLGDTFVTLLSVQCACLPAVAKLCEWLFKGKDMMSCR